MTHHELPERWPEHGARAPAIGVLGHFGDRNLGDEAIVEAFIARVRAEWPALDVRIFSMHPCDSGARYRCAAYSIRQETENETEFRIPEMRRIGALAGPAISSLSQASATAGKHRSFLHRIARVVPKGRLRSAVGSIAHSGLVCVRELGFLRRSIQRAKGLDALYVTGSNQFLDNFGGPWGFPYTLLKWTAICRLVGARVHFVSVGAGPLESRLSKWMIARALAMADYVSFRDEGSRMLIASECGIGGPVVPDLAHSLNFPAPPAQDGLSSSGHGPIRIAINAMPVYDPRYWHEPNPEKYGAYVRAIGEIARRLRAAGHSVSFFATQFPDASVARDALLSGACSSQASDSVIEVPDTVQQVMEVLSRSDIVIATRFHGILLALLAGKPTVGICYYRKSKELLNEAGMQEFAFNIDTLDAAELVAATERLVADRLAVATRIAKTTARCREKLQEQYVMLTRSLTQRIDTP